MVVADLVRPGCKAWKDLWRGITHQGRFDRGRIVG